MSCTTKTWEFSPGEHKTLEIQLYKYNKSIDCKEPLSLAALDTIELEIPATPSNLIFTKVTAPAVVSVSDPLGKIKIDLLPAQTNVMISGTVVVRINEATACKVAIGGAIKRLSVPGC